MSEDASGGQEPGWRSWLMREHRLAYERTLLALLWIGAAATTIGTVVAIGSTFTDVLDPEQVFRYSIWSAAGGLALTTGSILLTWPIRRLSRHKAEDRRGSRYERRRNWTRLKTGSILLSILVGFAAVEIALAIFSAYGTRSIEPPGTFSVERITLVLVLATALDVAYAHRIALRTERRRTTVAGIPAMFLSLAIGASVVLAGTAAFVAIGPTALPFLGEITPHESVLFLVAAVGCQGVSLFIARELPTIKAVFLEEREFRQESYLSRRKSVVMPTMIAFALLFLVLLVTFVFEISVVGGFEDIGQNAVLFGAFGFILAALLASVVVSVSLSRSEEETPLYRQLRSGEEKAKLSILAASLLFALVFLGLTIGVATGNGLLGIDVAASHWIDVLTVGILASIGPYGFYHASEARRIRNIEERFPDFLRDLSANRKAGLTLTNSLKVCAKGDYGELTPDIEKMAEQITWNVGFEDVLERFADRVDTPLVHRATSLIVEASRSGGHVTDVLEAAATDAREIKTLESERRLTMSLYTVVIYVAFLVFLGVAATLYGQFIPEVLASTSEVSGGSMQASGGPIGSLGASGMTLADFRTFFFVASVAQGLGNGMLAGMMESGEALNGLRHAFAMTAITLVAFVFFLG